MPDPRALRSSVCFAAALVLSSAPAGAQPAPPAQLVAVDEARAAYEAGIAHLDGRRYQEAALALERSRALREVPVVLYNLALAHRGLGQYRRAVGLFDRYLESPGAGVAPERIAAVRAEREELERALVHATITVTPASATLRVDGGDPRPSPETLELDPGPHVLEWSAPAHRPHREPITATPGQRRPFTVALEPIREGRLQVDASYPSVEIAIDGVRVGVGRVDRELPVGDHVVTLRAASYRDVRRRVTVQPGVTVRVVVTMERQGTPGWVLPVVIVGAAAVAGAVVAGVLIASQPDVPPLVHGSWGTVRE